MKKFLKIAVAGLLASQLSLTSTAILAQESSSEDSSDVEEVLSEDSVSEEDEVQLDSTSSTTDTINTLLTEASGTPALLQAKEYYIEFLNQFQIGDLYYGYDLGPTMAEITENFDGGVEPQAYEISDYEMILEYVYNGEEIEEDISQALLENEEVESTEESEEATEETTVVTEEPEEKLATLYVYFYEDEAILAGLVSNYHDVDYETFMDQNRVVELLESNASVDELAAETPVFTGHAFMFHNEVPVEIFATFSGTSMDDALIEFFIFEDEQIVQVYDEPLAAGGLGIDYLMYYKLSAYAEGYTNEEARIPTEDEAESVEEVEESTEESTETVDDGSQSEESTPDDSTSDESTPDDSTSDESDSTDPLPEDPESEESASEE
ncbi:hypothetical protein [Fundicoccus culcitae]|uniref:Uncharacterized protein n=1 Tax=Fundicoccus culcitae TaxID=2969821 RepID=A0ABY5P545_9LACT|nr:hypothetical protein [Fundicoccus culcitae]UUX33862.1 hypothetical protein NRE15_13405 [Fundicoccus culcitae]